jgi:hypothetical protein
MTNNELLHSIIDAASVLLKADAEGKLANEDLGANDALKKIEDELDDLVFAVENP